MSDVEYPEHPDEAIENVAAEQPNRLVTAQEVGDAVTAGVGIAQQHAEVARASRRGEGRRVALARQRGGSYGIWLGGRHVQGFCNEWEDITNFQLPEGFEQQIRIRIEMLGDVRELTSERDQERPPEPDQMRDPWDGADLIRLFNELPGGHREVIAREIHERHQAHHGVALRAQAHPTNWGDQATGEQIAGELQQHIRSRAVQDTMQRVERMLVSVIEEMRRL